jgi:hypothetical protein
VLGALALGAKAEARLAAAADAKARWNAVFNEAVLAALPPDESAALRQFRTPHGVDSLDALAVEGTTPASGLLFQRDEALRLASQEAVSEEASALKKLAPSIGRSVKVLHVDASGEHAFYHDFVELSVAIEHPLFADAALREAGLAASQFVLANPDASGRLQAGATSRQVAEGEFHLLPLTAVSSPAAEALQLASDISDANVVPPRREPLVLRPRQVKNLGDSAAAVEKLEARVEAKGEAKCEGACVAYTLSLSSMVNNPLAVQHFCDRVASQAKAVIVETRSVPGLLRGPEGELDAPFSHISVVV